MPIQMNPETITASASPMRHQAPKSRLRRKLARVIAGSSTGRTTADAAASSPAELLNVISDLESVIAEQEATNAFLRDLLAEKWFDTPTDDADPTRDLQLL